MCVLSKACRCSLAVVVFSALWATAKADLITPPITDFDTGQPVMYPSYLTEYEGMLYFRSRLPGDGSVTGLWSCDGAYAYHVDDTGLGGVVTQPSYLGAYNGNLYFAGTASSGATRLWQYNPASGVSLAPGSDTGTQQNPEELTAYNGDLYFRATRYGNPPTNIGTELWKFDGASQTPIDMFPGTGNSYPQHFIEYDGQLYFNACGESGQGTELWRYNGSGMPTNAATIYPNNGSSPEQFAIYDNRLFFSAYDGVHGRELWSYDATTGTPSLVADIALGGQYDSSNPSNLCVYDGKLYFSATDGPDQKHGYELWSYDGTTPERVTEINPTTDYFPGDDFEMDSSPADLTVFNGLLYFSANDGSHGRELWSFDGTTAEMVADINPGLYGSEVSELTVYQNRLYFSADDHFTGVGDLQPRAFALAVPEPGTLLLAAMAGLGMLAYARRRQINARSRS
ncbi:MAG TPA: PEP-CTERM sorting domain-containing protein [Thermoguttaceae bacterium]|nr:PEP-CTERM sorting domain-containing protein [Thermoguttaceae bacterium]